MPFHVLGNHPPNDLAWRQRLRRHTPQSQRATCLDDRPVLSSGSMLNSVAGFSSNVAQYRTEGLMTGPTQDTASNPARTTPGYRMVSPFLTMNGGAAVTAAWTWPWTSIQGLFRNRWWPATSAIALVVLRCLLDSASVVTTGAVWSTLLHQLVCRYSIRCVDSTRTWQPDQARTSRTCGSIG
eukprot:6491173-Amphidinium_carterae.1